MIVRVGGGDEGGREKVCVGVWEGKRRKLKQQQTAMMKLSQEVLFGNLDFSNWQTETRQIPAALVVDCRGVHDDLARSSSSCLGLKDKKSGLEALALKQSLVE